MDWYAGRLAGIRKLRFRRKRLDDGPHAAQMVGDMVVNCIGVVPRPADAPAAEGDALEGLRSAVAPGVGEGTNIILSGACGSERRGLRPVGEVCVVGFQMQI